ncbi:MAG: glycogen synthase [Anaerolineae bacterium]|jgi:starch synthase|nr:glycogen synthase [Anaerolineae bacterium]MBT4458544.1 glycogen synthase [Anaerolineae bacterium]MBT4842720.1 glycogen synthase [Anaerolineae bacterium]MBT6063127.1 glycogen synthase [Anaerolineae bacterium]MBT7775893.1 glycogen synthase [Anaerolineae bacterium]
MKTIKVLFMAAEAAPFVKIGGLADVAGALPAALRALSEEDAGGVKLDVRLVLPLHMVIRTEAATLRPIASFAVKRSGVDIGAQVYEMSSGDMPVYFIAGEPITTSASVYSANAALDGEKYTFFSLAALEMTKHLDWEPDIIHANDWHTALTAYALQIEQWNGKMQDTKALLTVHNLPFLGPDLTGRLAAYGLPLSQTDLPEWAHAQALPLGLWASKKNVAVSPTYAEEMLTKKLGAGLENYLTIHKDKLMGIVNGIDAESFNPETDKAIPARFSAETLKERSWNKAALQQLAGLEIDSTIPIFGIVSRMTDQKGIDLALSAISRLKRKNWQAVILGTGDPTIEKQAKRLEKLFPDRVKVEIRYDEGFARKIYAGSDIFLMPSRYEPCGLSQMIAMRYGCIPITRATGGLKDTIKHGETGFLFEKEDAKALLKSMRETLEAYENNDHWQSLQRNAMAQDFSWKNSAKQYADLYKSL